MDIDSLALKLKEMYFNSRDGETATMVHLFGIKYASEISRNKLSPKSIAKKAGIPESYGVEINKGCNLAKYVITK